MTICNMLQYEEFSVFHLFNTLDHYMYHNPEQDPEFDVDGNYFINEFKTKIEYNVSFNVWLLNANMLIRMTL